MKRIFERIPWAESFGESLITSDDYFRNTTQQQTNLKHNNSGVSLPMLSPPFVSMNPQQKDWLGMGWAWAELRTEILGFSSCGFQITESINISAQRTCFMLCENLMSHLIRKAEGCAWCAEDDRRREPLNKCQGIILIHFMIHDHPFKSSLLKAQWALSCPSSLLRTHMHNLEFNWNFIFHENRSGRVRGFKEDIVVHQETLHP